MANRILRSPSLSGILVHRRTTAYPGRLLRLATLLVAMVAGSGVTSAAMADDFYKNKTIRLIIGTDTGGSYDLSGRLIAKYLGRHVPGNPTIIVQNMLGAGSIVAANFISEVAPQDGTVIGAILQTLLMQSQISKDNQIKFDIRRLNWIGNPASGTVNVLVTWHDAPVKTIKEAQEKTVAIGLTSMAATDGVEFAIVQNLLGTKLKAVTGYKGGNEINIAMERGEIFGRIGQSWSGWKQTRPDWVRDKKLNVLVQIGRKPADDLPDIPLLNDIPTDKETRQLVALYSDTIALGRPLIAGPQVPADRIAILRKGFHDLMADEEYLSEARKVCIDVEPLYGEDFQEFVAKWLSTPPELISKLNAALAADR